ncbi:hypothetical protein L204_104210 [Cryptococcus depauperatus]|nr:hypothetical protein L204_04968 [Cryptococcus depauperatus CBS 7855]
MPSHTSFFIPDTSPIFSYSPCANCQGKSSWTAAYTPRGDGYDQTLHMLSPSASSVDSLIGVNITASALRFNLGLGTSNECKVEYRINGSSWKDACAPEKDQNYVVSDLPAGLHQVELRPKVDSAAGSTGQNILQFYGLGGELSLASSGKMSNLTIDSTSPLFKYSPSTAWTSFASSGPLSSPTNNTLTTLYNDTSSFYNGTLGVSTTQGGKVDLKFKGEAVYIYGLAGKEGGKARVELDGVFQGMVDMAAPWTSYSSLLYAGSGFDQSQAHTLSLINQSPGQQLIIDYALLTTKSDSTGGPNLQLIIGLISGISALLLLLGVAFYAFYIRRRFHGRSRKKVLPYSQSTSNSPYPFSLGYGGYAGGGSVKDGCSSQRSSSDIWKKGSGASESSATPTLLHFSAHRDQHERTRGARSPPINSLLDYPEYVPYRGPIEPPPSQVSNEDREEFSAYDGYMGSGPRSANTGRSATPPLIAGANPTAVGWLAARQFAVTPVKTPSTASQTSRSNQWAKFDTIALNDYQIQKPITPSPLSGVGSTPRTGRDRERGRDCQSIYSPISSISTPSSLGLSGVQVRAMGASRSVARLWPTKDAVPSNYRTGSFYLANDEASRPSPRLASSQNNSSSVVLNPPTSVDSLPNTTNDPSGSPSLRRGVSIKSIKTMRSFFSGLIFVPSSNSNTVAGGSPVPITPNLPSAARPDSGIFGPLGGGLDRSLSRGPSMRRVGGGATGLGVTPHMTTNVTTPTSSNLPPSSFTFPSPLQRTPTPRIHNSYSNQLVPRKNDGREREEGVDGEEHSPDFFIELDPNSPVTASRPGSQWTRYTRGSAWVGSLEG